jgi:predicted RNA-binding Zn ribbon-like protein
MSKTAPKPFELLADHPVLDFINTRDDRFAARGGSEKLSSYADLLRFSEQAGLLDARQVRALCRRKESPAAARALKHAHVLRESLAAAFYEELGGSKKPSARSLKLLQAHLRAAAAHQELTWQKTPASAGGVALRAAWRWGEHAAQLMLPVWILAQAAESLLTSRQLELVHQCRSETCRWLFLDSSRNHSRRWCDMRVCGNRVKARRFRAQHPTFR